MRLAWIRNTEGYQAYFKIGERAGRAVVLESAGQYLGQVTYGDYFQSGNWTDKLGNARKWCGREIARLAKRTRA